MNQQQEQLDPSIIALTKAIGRQESGGDYNRIGDNGHSKGAYQWNNSKAKLAPDEIPTNFRDFASQIGADANDFSPANQDRVAYKTIEKWGKEGLTPAQIASRWNSGKADAYKTAQPGYNAEQGVKHDVKGYVDSVSKYYQEYTANMGTASASGSQGTTYKGADLTKDQIIGGSQPQQGETLAVANTGRAMDWVPGHKLAQGLAYAIGGKKIQEELGESQDNAREVQEGLILQIQKAESEGRDTTRLKNALRELGGNMDTIADQTADAGTGGITSKQVLKSSASLATLPALAAARTAMTASRALPALADPTVKSIFKSFLGPGEKLSKLNTAQKIDILSDALKTASPGEKAVLRNAIKALSEAPVAKTGIIPRIIKGGVRTAKNMALGSILGDKVAKMLD